ncbi:MAG: hypothetical protein RBU29_09620, partial [bacterium]|nr:hypothetical protein [bacterium]
GPNADILLQADLTGSLGYTFCLRKSSTQVETTPNHGYHVAEFATPYTLKTATTNWGTFMLYPSLQWEATLQTSDRDFDHPQGTYKTTLNGFDLHDEEEMVLPFVFDPTGSLGIGVDHTIDETDPEDNWLGLILVIKGSESAPLLVPEPQPEFSFNSHIITHPYLNLWQSGFEMIQTGYGLKSGHQRSLKADTVEWINDISCLRVLISDSESGIWLIFRFAQDTEGNVRLIHRQFWENGVPMEDQYFDNPPIFLPAMLQVGTEIYHGIDDGVATVAAMDTTVPSNEFGYGPYSPCIQVMQVYHGGSDIDYEYLAPGLGMIQRDLGSDDGPGGYKVSSITYPGQEPTPTPWEFPTATPTPECPPQPTPGVQRYAVHEFAEDSLSQTGWNEIPGGFGNATPGVYRIGYALLPGLIPSSQDQKGMQVSVRAGEVTFLYAPSLDLQNKHFYARMTLRSDGADVQLVLGALRGDMATQYNLDGSLEMHLIRTATAFIEQEKKMELTYRPDQGTIITPFLQISANGETPVTVWIDRIEFYLLDRTPDSQ